MELLLPFHKGGLLAAVRSQGQLLSEDYTAEGIEATVLVSDPALVAELRKYCK
jgi:hypothetical protein